MMSYETLEFANLIIARQIKQIEELQIKNDRLSVLVDERDGLVDNIYSYGKKNPTSSPQCVI